MRIRQRGKGELRGEGRARVGLKAISCPILEETLGGRPRQPRSVVYGFWSETRLTGCLLDRLERRTENGSGWLLFALQELIADRTQSEKKKDKQALDVVAEHGTRLFRGCAFVVGFFFEVFRFFRLGRDTRYINS